MHLAEASSRWSSLTFNRSLFLNKGIVFQKTSPLVHLWVWTSTCFIFALFVCLICMFVCLFVCLFSILCGHNFTCRLLASFLAFNTGLVTQLVRLFPAMRGGVQAQLELILFYSHLADTCGHTVSTLYSGPQSVGHSQHYVSVLRCPAARQLYWDDYLQECSYQ